MWLAATKWYPAAQRVHKLLQNDTPRGNHKFYQNSYQPPQHTKHKTDNVSSTQPVPPPTHTHTPGLPIPKTPFNFHRSAHSRADDTNFVSMIDQPAALVRGRGRKHSPGLLIIEHRKVEITERKPIPIRLQMQWKQEKEDIRSCHYNQTDSRERVGEMHYSYTRGWMICRFVRVVCKLFSGVLVVKPLLLTPLSTPALFPGTHLSTPYALACHRLHVSTIPRSLPCRETEFTEVYIHLSAAVVERNGSCLGITGTPVTGKPISACEVTSQLRYLVALEELDDDSFVKINGMKAADPYQAYSLLQEEITGDRSQISAPPVFEGFLG
ncbi:hypothetical protein HOY82DRAFT_621993 [Tuber indicum]|nr:hypothetical protein HOY82DRAFT_621993 [Tuber indicum]